LRGKGLRRSLHTVIMNSNAEAASEIKSNVTTLLMLWP
jgi:hypothetical protein